MVFICIPKFFVVRVGINRVLPSSTDALCEGNLLSAVP